MSEGVRDLERFLLRLGAALDGIGVPVNVIEERLRAVAHQYGARTARIAAFPTSLLLSLGHGEHTVLEITPPLSNSPRLDQVAAVEQLASEAEQGLVDPSAGIAALHAIRHMPRQFGTLLELTGAGIISVGICLLLRPSAKDVACAAVLGVVVGLLRRLGRRDPTLQLLTPVGAALVVSAAVATATRTDLADPGLRAMIAALIVLVPGAALTTAVWELAAREMIAGASRLVWSFVQLALLAFGILAGVALVNLTPREAFTGSSDLLGGWAPWVGVAMYAGGVTLAYSTPPRALPGLLIVMYVAYGGQRLGDLVFDSVVSGFVGALVMTPAAYGLARTRIGLPAYGMFLPGFWLLVPGAISLLGLTQHVTDLSSATSASFTTVMTSILSVVLGVLCGTLLHRLVADRRTSARPGRRT